MKLLAKFWLLLFLFSITNVAYSKIILALGDSLTAAYGIDPAAGWTSLLQQRLIANNYTYTVINAGISGDTTSMGRTRLPKLLTTHKPDIVIIALGSNDGLQGLDPSLVQENLNAMVEHTLQIGAKVLLLGAKIPINYGPKYRELLSATYTNTAEKFGVTLMPFILEDVALNPDYLLPDQLHPNAKGQKVMLDNIWPYLKPLLN